MVFTNDHVERDLKSDGRNNMPVEFKVKDAEKEKVPQQNSRMKNESKLHKEQRKGSNKITPEKKVLNLKKDSPKSVEPVTTKMKSQINNNTNKNDVKYPQMSNQQKTLVTQMVFLDIKIGEEEVGRIEIGLFGNDVPKTAANFKGLCEGFTDKGNGQSYSLKGTKFHRVIQKFMIQGGDLHRATSIFGGMFPDENFKVKYYGPGWVGMANSGKDTNSSQFFIATADTSWLYGKHVVFGKVIKGMDVVYKIEKNKTNKQDAPVIPVVVINAGVLPTKPFLTDNSPAVN